MRVEWGFWELYRSEYVYSGCVSPLPDQRTLIVVGYSTVSVLIEWYKVSQLARTRTVHRRWIESAQGGIVNA